MDIRLNQHERDALYGKRYFLKCLYIFGIRPFMDFRTGLARVSWYLIRKELCVDPEPGVPSDETGWPTESKVRRGAEALERLGLIKKKHIKTKNGTCIIFDCLLATRDYSVQKQADTIPTPQADTQAGILQFPSKPRVTIVSADGIPQADPQADTPSWTQADTVPDIRNIIKKKDITNVISKKESSSGLSLHVGMKYLQKFIETYPAEDLDDWREVKDIFFKTILDEPTAVKNQQALERRLENDKKLKAVGIFVPSLPRAKNWIGRRYFEHKLKEVEDVQTNRAVVSSSGRGAEISKMFRWVEEQQQLAQNDYELSESSKY